MDTVMSKNIKGIGFEVQYVISDKIYRKLYEIMCSLSIASITINFEEFGEITVAESSTQKGLVYFYLTSKNTTIKIDNYLGRSGYSGGDILKHAIGQINFNKPLSTTELECPVFIVMQKNENKDILEDINDIPIFSPTREVIIEKISNNGRRKKN